MKNWQTWVVAATLIGLVGCGGVYSWRPTVPAERRTVAVPTLRNESKVPEFGAVAARQLLREFQREGTFKIVSADEAAIEVQGKITSVKANSVAFDRHGSRKASYEAEALAVISVIDRRTQKVLIDNRQYRATVTFSAGGDSLNAKRDASGRLADELSRMVVDDVLNLKW